MKTFNTILKIGATLAAVFVGALAVQAAGAGQFNPNPAGGTTGFFSIHPDPSIQQGDCTNCANQNNGITVNVPNYNDMDTFSVYLDFHNMGSGTITNAKAEIDVLSGGQIRGRLTGGNATNSGITDSAYLYGLPSSYDIEFISAYTENTHTAPNCPGYSYYQPGWTESQVNAGVNIYDLDTVQNGWCDQGYLIATYRVRNTEPQTPTVEVTTLMESMIGTTSARLNGRLDQGSNTSVWFALTTNSNPSCTNSSHISGNSVSGTYNSGQSFYKDRTGLSVNTHYYYRACAQQPGGSVIAANNVEDFYTGSVTSNVDVSTLSPNVGTNTVTLNGRLLQGENVDTWFRYSMNQNTVSCSNGTPVYGPNNIDAIQNFSANVSVGALNTNVTYYYVACGQNATSSDQGSVQSFIIQGQPVNLEVETLNPTNVELYNGGLNAQATLKGRVISGNTNFVYFVFGPSSVSISCYSGFNRVYPLDHTDPRGPGDTFESNQLGLVPETTYHYQACANDSHGDTAIGDVVSFTTPGEGSGNGQPQADTQGPDNVDEDSAELNGRIEMNDVNNGIVFFVYGQDEDRIADVAFDYNTYDQVESDEDNDDFMVTLVDPDNDDDGWRNYDKNVYSLDANERYYYQICVEYVNESGNDDLECGGVEDFRTDNDGNNNNVEIQTENPRNVTQTTAEMCGDLVDDDGSSQQTWIEFRSSYENYYNQTPTRQRSEGLFCERVTGLQPNTTYIYRACTPEDCDATRSFRTLGTTVTQGQPPIITTDNPTNIRSNSAVLNGTYVANAPSGTCWFDYGRTSALGRQTRSYAVTGYGACTHSFTNLASNTTYCVQAVIETIYGTDRGSVRCFTTPPGTGGPTPPPVVVIDDETDIDLSTLGLGLSLVRLEIDDSVEVVSRDQAVEYVVEWENITRDLDLNDLSLKVVMPPEIQVVSASRGQFDADTNTLYFTIDRLDAGEQGFLTVDGIVGKGTVGNLVTAEAEIAYDNPINDAQEDAIDWDVDGYGVRVAGVTASVFGLANITFLGWLVILLGLFIIFLVARWLYLEREEMRAQAYAGYTPYAGTYHDPYAPAVPPYQEPRYREVPPPAAPAPQDDYYQPYRPNRG